jgi:hypothetical protein
MKRRIWKKRAQKARQQRCITVKRSTDSHEYYWLVGQYRARLDWAREHPQDYAARQMLRLVANSMYGKTIHSFRKVGRA